MFDSYNKPVNGIRILMALSIFSVVLSASVPMTAYGHTGQGRTDRINASAHSAEMTVGQYKAKKFTSSRTPAGQKAKYRPTPAGKPVKPNPAGTPAGKRTKPNPAGTPEVVGGCAIGMAGSCNPR